MTPDLVDQILFAARTLPDEVARHTIALLINTLKTPTADPQFIAIGSHTRADGKAFTVYALGADLPKTPHRDGTPLTPAEIQDTVKTWNEDARKIPQPINPILDALPKP